MIKKIANKHNSIRFQYSRLLKKLDSDQLAIHKTIDRYLSAYCFQNNLSVADVVNRYMAFVENYSNALSVFKRTGKYPFQTANDFPFNPDRITYDIFLMVTPLITYHRFQIMQNVYESCQLALKNALCSIVGVGSGLEIELISKYFESIDAYDLSLSPFVKTYFPKVYFNETVFTNNLNTKYDYIYAIELLEHVEDPYSLISALKHSLKPNGKIVTTTVKNVPQHDHVYNFSDSEDFEIRISEIGLNITYKKVIEHDYLMNKVEANNIFYILVRS